MPHCLSIPADIGSALESSLLLFLIDWVAWLIAILTFSSFFSVIKRFSDRLEKGDSFPHTCNSLACSRNSCADIFHNTSQLLFCVWAGSLSAHAGHKTSIFANNFVYLLTSHQFFRNIPLIFLHFSLSLFQIKRRCRG